MNHIFRAGCAVLAWSFAGSLGTTVQGQSQEKWVAFEAGASSEINRLIVNSAEQIGLSQQQIHQLAERHEALLASRLGESAEQYINLMLSWGGSYRIDPNSAEVKEAQITDWHPRGTECAWKSSDLSAFEIGRIEGLGTAHALTAGWPRGDSGAPFALAFGTFTFAGGTDELVRAGAPVVEIRTNIQSNDGTISDFGIRWVWDEANQQWYPWHVKIQGQPRKAICVLFY